MKRSALPLMAQCRIPEPLAGLGPLTLAATEQGLALAWFDDQRHRSPAVDAPVDARHPVLRRAAAAFADYGGNGRLGLDRLATADGGDLPLDPRGTPFQQAVWRVLRQIPAGTVLRYREVAERIGAPQAVRAVGAAIGRNPIGILVPCHRVIGSDGQLTGYAGGLHRKQALLTHEDALPRQP